MIIAAAILFTLAVVVGAFGAVLAMHGTTYLRELERAGDDLAESCQPTTSDNPKAWAAFDEWNRVRGFWS